MFKKMKNIDSAFRHIRMFSLLFLTGCVGISLYALYSSYEATTKLQEKIYVLANGKVLEAYASERKDNIPVEAKDHISVFHHYFFTLDPDDKMIQANITKALYLADASAKQQYDILKESNYYSNLISGNISQEIQTDSIEINIQTYPYYFRYKARQKIIRPKSIVTRSLVTEGYLRNVARSDNNAHGFLIERWRTLENMDVNVQTR